MYAVTFDIDTNCLDSNYHGNNYQNAYGDIRMLRIEENNDLMAALGL